MNLVLYALRETFYSKTFALQFIFAVIIGVGTVVGLNSYKSNLQKEIFKESKTIMGGDLLIESSFKINKEVENFIDSNLPKKSKKANTVHFSSMIYTKKKETTLALVKAQSKTFPLYGEIITEPKNCFLGLKGNEAILEPNLQKNLKLKIGDTFFIGKTEFRVKCSLLKEPAQVGSFTSFAPSLIIPIQSLEDTGLETKGSRIRYNILVSLPDSVDSKKFKEESFAKFIEKDLTIYHNTEIGSGSQRFISSTFDYMSLLGLSAFFLGTISLFLSTRARFKDRSRTIATLKCLGADSIFIIKIFLLEILILASIGTLLGLFFAYYFQFLIPDLTGSEFLNNIQPSLNLYSVLWGILIGLGIPIFISIESILKIKDLSPLYSLREEFQDSIKINFLIKRLDIIMIVLSYILFYGIASFETKSFLKGFILSVVLLVIPILLFIAYQVFRILIRFILPLLSWKSELRFVLQKIQSTGSGLLLPILGVGSGLIILLLSMMIRTSLLVLSGANQIEKRPNIFVLDIRAEQIQEFKNIQKKFTKEDSYLSPMIASRLFSINNKPIEKKDTEKDAIKRDWRATARTREYFLSYRDNLYSTEKVVEGKFWNKNSKDEISIEADFAKNLGVKIGDTLEFNIQGIKLGGKITNFRTVNWADMKPNFVVLFSRGSLESAPAFYINFFRLEESDSRYNFQKELISKLPNLTVIDAEKAILNATSIIDKVTGVIGLMTSFILVSGILVLLSSLYANQKTREEEIKLFRIIGASSHSLYKIIIWEAVLVSVYSFLCAFLLSSLSNWILSTYFLNLRVNFPYLEIVSVFVLLLIICILLYSISVKKFLRKYIKST
jgi:predicted lysophospholipase L1 biosynthesis ABC-type transport system permease subunit